MESNNKNVEDEKQYYDEKFKSISMRFYAYLNKNYSQYISSGLSDFLTIKMEHTIRIINNAEEIARREGLSEEDVYIAKIVALFHDLGHFENSKKRILRQKIEKEHAEVSFDLLFEQIFDKNVNQILNDDGTSKILLDYFSVDKKYHDIIGKAVKNHSKYRIDETDLDKQELLHAKLIRDADKLDIYFVRLKDGSQLAMKRTQDIKFKDQKFSIEAYECLMRGQLLNFTEMKEKYGVNLTGLDVFMNSIAFAFEFEFSSSFEILRNRQYLSELQKKYKFVDPITQRMVNDIYRKVEEYIKENTKTNERNDKILENEKEKIIANLSKMFYTCKGNSRDNNINDNDRNF